MIKSLLEFYSNTNIKGDIILAIALSVLKLLEKSTCKIQLFINFSFTCLGTDVTFPMKTQNLSLFFILEIYE